MRPTLPFVRRLLVGKRAHIARRVRPLRLPPQPPLRKGGQLPAGGRSHIARRELPRRRGACDRKLAGRTTSTRVGGRFLSGGNFLCAYPPWPPLRKGAAGFSVAPPRNAGGPSQTAGVQPWTGLEIARGERREFFDFSNTG